MSGARMLGSTLTISRPDGPPITLHCTDADLGERLARLHVVDLIEFPVGITLTVDGEALEALDAWFVALDESRARLRAPLSPARAQRGAPAQWKRERSPLRYR